MKALGHSVRMGDTQWALVSLFLVGPLGKFLEDPLNLADKDCKF